LFSRGAKHTIAPTPNGRTRAPMRNPLSLLCLLWIDILRLVFRQSAAQTKAAWFARHQNPSGISWWYVQAHHRLILVSSIILQSVRTQSKQDLVMLQTKFNINRGEWATWLACLPQQCPLICLRMSASQKEKTALTVGVTLNFPRQTSQFQRPMPVGSLSSGAEAIESAPTSTPWCTSWPSGQHCTKSIYCLCLRWKIHDQVKTMPESKHPPSPLPILPGEN